MPQQSGAQRSSRVLQASAWLILGGAAACGTQPLADEYPCVIAMDSPGVVLRGDTAITFEDPGFGFTVDSRGRIYGDVWFGGRLLQWAPDGTLERVIGSPGEGPGEFGLGAVTPFVATRDTLYVRDSRRRWLVFDPEYRFIRNAPLGVLTTPSGQNTVFVGDSLVYSATTTPLAGPGIVTITDRFGTPLTSLGPLRTSVGGVSPLAVEPDGTVWIWGGIGPASPYQVQRWAVGHDTALQVITRQVPWFRPDSARLRIPQTPERRPFLYPMVRGIVLDEDGLLWVMSDVPKSAAVVSDVETVSGDSLRAVLDRSLNRHMEVIDPRTGTALAHREVGRSFDFIPGTGNGVRKTETDDGEREIAIVPYRLVRADGGRCEVAAQ